MNEKKLVESALERRRKKLYAKVATELEALAELDVELEKLEAAKRGVGEKLVAARALLGERRIIDETGLKPKEQRELMDLVGSGSSQEQDGEKATGQGPAERIASTHLNEDIQTKAEHDG